MDSKHISEWLTVEQVIGRYCHPDGPEPVRFGPYVVHAMGQTLWFTPAHNSDAQSHTRQ